MLPKEIEAIRGRSMRVLTFDYSPNLSSSSLEGHTSKLKKGRDMTCIPQMLELHSRRLMEELIYHRKYGGGEKRPIVFVAHSFGSLIVKKALADASTAIYDYGCPRKAIELLAIGVVFLGTPHRDYHSEHWIPLLMRMCGVENPSPPDESGQTLASVSRSLDLLLTQYEGIESNFPDMSLYEGKEGLVEEFHDERVR